MSNAFGPIDIDCDAPPYGIVRACQRLGYHAPEDVRWCQAGRPLTRPTGWRELFRQAWRIFRGGPRPGSRTCLCGLELPQLEKCSFTLQSGRVASYSIGQCPQCHTIFWEDA